MSKQTGRDETLVRSGSNGETSPFRGEPREQVGCGRPHRRLCSSRRGGLREDVPPRTPGHHVHAQGPGGVLQPGSKGGPADQETEAGVGVSSVRCSVLWAWRLTIETHKT